jgi:hypothetical protein
MVGLMNLTKPGTVEEYVFVMWEGAKRQPLGTFNGFVACLVGKDTVEAVFMLNPEGCRTFADVEAAAKTMFVTYDALAMIEIGESWVSSPASGIRPSKDPNRRTGLVMRMTRRGGTVEMRTAIYLDDQGFVEHTDTTPWKAHQS